MCEKCVFNVGFCSWTGEFTKSVMDSPTLQNFPQGRSIGQLRPTHQNSLFIFSQCTHTHPHCPVPTSLDSVMTGNNSTINDAIDKWGPWPVDSTYQKRSTNTHSSCSNCRLMDY